MAKGLSNEMVLQENKKKYEGMTKVANNGLEMTLIEYFNADNCTVQFEDGEVRNKITLHSFIRGLVRHPKYPRGSKVYNKISNGYSQRVFGCKEKYEGMELMSNHGVRMILKEYIDSTNCVVVSEFGEEKTGIPVQNFLNGTVRFDSDLKYRYKVGDINIAKNGMKMEIIDINKSIVRVRFEDGFITEVETPKFSSGYVRNINMTRKSNKGYAYVGCFKLYDSTKFGDKNNIYYHAVCEKCGYDDILTPSEMLEHKCEE